MLADGKRSAYEKVRQNARTRTYLLATCRLSTQVVLEVLERRKLLLLSSVARARSFELGGVRRRGRRFLGWTDQVCVLSMPASRQIANRWLVSSSVESRTRPESRL